MATTEPNGTTDTTTNATGDKKSPEGKYAIPADIAALSDMQLAMLIVRETRLAGLNTDVSADEDEEVEVLDPAAFAAKLAAMSPEELMNLQSVLVNKKSKSAAANKPERLFKAEWALKNRIWQSIPPAPKGSDDAKKKEVKDNRKAMMDALITNATRVVDFQDAQATKK